VITFTLDWSSPQPVYRQIADQLRGLIARGELADGAELPSVRQLAATIGINLNTVAKAYRTLADEGLVDLRHGSRARVQRAREPAAEAAHLERQLDDVLSRMVLRGDTREDVETFLERALERFYPKDR
jgi:GntR family transcriptional regulator